MGEWIADGGPGGGVLDGSSDQDWVLGSGGKPTPPKLLEEGHVVEMRWLKDQAVWTVVPINDAYANTGRAPLTLRWGRETNIC